MLKRHAISRRLAVSSFLRFREGSALSNSPAAAGRQGGDGLEHFLDGYLAAAGIGDQDKTPLFRSAAGRTGDLTDRPMHRVDAYAMVRRRTAEAGLKGKLGCHVFRATGITVYLDVGGTLENAQAMAAHESPRTTKLYDRTGDGITLDEVERIISDYEPSTNAVGRQARSSGSYWR